MDKDTTMNIDPYNIKRGPCLKQNCDCAGYIRTENKIPCSYCDCPPAKHQRLGKLFCKLIYQNCW